MRAQTAKFWTFDFTIFINAMAQCSENMIFIAKLIRNYKKCFLHDLTTSLQKH